MHTFYYPDLSADTLTLDEEESKHAVRVLRLAVGDEAQVTDGKGTRATVTVTDDHPKHCSFRIIRRKKESTGRNFSLHIAIAPSKNADRTEWFVEKAVEMGIDRITLLECEHSERTTMKTERLSKLAVSAMKQSQQCWLPEIHEMISFDDFVKKAEPHSQRYIAHCGEKQKMLAGLLRNDGEILILIGPEGDFSEGELKLAIKHGFRTVSLGKTRLRTETAALVAVMSVHLTVGE